MFVNTASQCWFSCLWGKPFWSHREVCAFESVAFFGMWSIFLACVCFIFFLSETVQNVKDPQEIQQVHRREKRSYANSLEKYVILKYVNRAIGFNPASDRCAYRLQERKQNKTNRKWIKIQEKKGLIFTVATLICFMAPFSASVCLPVKRRKKSTDR